MIWSKEKVEPPENNEEFETSVLRAIESMRNDGSIYFSYRDICQYNRWVISRMTSKRIGQVLNSKFSLIRMNNQNTYRIPEAA